MKKTIWRLVLAGVTAGISMMAQADTTVAELTLGQGVRLDDLNWNIGLNPTPNVLSELTWRDLEINQTQAGFLLHNQKVLFKGEFRYGQIEEGDNQDSDYLGDNRTDEFIRSYSKTAGETVDGSFAMGYRLTTPTARFASTLTPLVGYAKHKQYLQMIEGRRTLPDPTPVALNGLNSSYDTEWQGLWLGVDASLHVTTKTVLSFAFAHYPDLKYRAVADWNLATRFQHPVSFTHYARGNGNHFAFSASYRLLNQLKAALTFTYDRMRARNGTDTTYLSQQYDNEVVQVSLNGVNWQSSAIMLTLTWSTAVKSALTSSTKLLSNPDMPP